MAKCNQLTPLPFKGLKAHLFDWSCRAVWLVFRHHIWMVLLTCCHDRTSPVLAALQRLSPAICWTVFVQTV